MTNYKHNKHYSIEIQKVVNQGIADLTSTHQQGKLANSPVTNTHFLTRWVTKQIKTKAFSTLVIQDLKAWQQQARSQGAKSNLEKTFKGISCLYAKHCSVEQPKNITDKQIENFLDAMEKDQWWVSTEFSVDTNVQIYTEGNNSLVLCATQCDDCFDEESLIQPMSFYIRGNIQQAIEKAQEHGLLLHKVAKTKGRAKVKYHVEYLVYPYNQGIELAEIPFSFLSAN